VGAERFKRYALDELLDHELYARLAARERNERNRKLLEELARDELRHHLFWSKLAGPVRLGLGDRLRLRLLLSLSRLAGKTFTIKLLERGEAATLSEYRRAAAELGGELAAELARVIEDEELHESELAGSLDELAVRQLGSIALGVSDAIIELTGVLAGFAGYTGSPLARMNPAVFAAATFSGSLPWNAAFALAGYALGEKWSEVLRYSSYLDLAGAAALALAAIYLAAKQIKRRRS
jgi:rubrerythrin